MKFDPLKKSLLTSFPLCEFKLLTRLGKGAFIYSSLDY